MILKPVYPRTYGEHVCRDVRTMLSAGLSPYLRGTPGKQLFGCLESRFIPVLTGNTLNDANDYLSIFGLSPYLRGTPLILSICFIRYF
ncbi:conserved hypothetical protein [Xenorhabdus nematophila str. Websteri]|nr:conserved hypothetical protein [Xenorhabdus nematophila str. Websteri]CEF32973.1 conserved hypothetical protein [Xenorhabdus nematophila str. Websteri]